MATNVSPLPFHLHLVGWGGGRSSWLPGTPPMYTFMPTQPQAASGWVADTLQTGPAGTLSFAVGRKRAGWEILPSHGSPVEHPLIRARQEQRSRPAWPARGQGPSSCAAASVAPGTVQKAAPCAPSRRTKGHIDWFVGAFPGVLYISLPRHRNEEAECSEEGRGRHTSIRVGFFILSISTLIRHVREGSSILGRAAIFIKHATSLITVC